MAGVLQRWVCGGRGNHLKMFYTHCDNFLDVVIYFDMATKLTKPNMVVCTSTCCMSPHLMHHVHTYTYVVCNWHLTFHCKGSSNISGYLKVHAWTTLFVIICTFCNLRSITFMALFLSWQLRLANSPHMTGLRLLSWFTHHLVEIYLIGHFEVKW